MAAEGPTLTALLIALRTRVTADISIKGVYVFGNRVAGSRLDRAYQGKREPDQQDFRIVTRGLVAMEEGPDYASGWPRQLFRARQLHC